MEISPRYNPNEIEEINLKKWLESSVFSAKKESSKKPYSIVIPPPNITGILHMGHALNNTLQDVLIRYKRMRGFESLWMPGTDHAGIATQNVVERSLAKKGLSKEDIGREEFTKRLWSWRDKYGSTIINQLKKIGASCDWQRLRFTMDDNYSRAVKKVFLRLFNDGHIYRGNYIINWCPRCRTALSDEEAAHKETEGWLYYIRYPVEPARPGKEHITVATTRPETMLGDTAVAINPKDKRYQWLKKVKVILPITERRLTVIEDEAVDPDFGTGIIKVTPSHDPVDFGLGKKHNLDFINIMNENATLNKNAPEQFHGVDRFEARAMLIEQLKKKKLIERKEPYRLGAGHCYRCNTIIEPRVSLQWFVKMKPLARPAIEAVEKGKIKFYPQRWKKVYLNWMNNIQDWCISRQIWWGHRIPVWYCKDCYDSQPDSKNFQKEGVIAAEKKPKKCPNCESTNIEQDQDVLDTWFSSWLWPFATFGWPFVNIEDRGGKVEGRGERSKEVLSEAEEKMKEEEEFKYFYPTNTLVTASEILFFWVARMIMASLEFTGSIPFSDVLIHGTVRDDKGIKMSKSLGNTIDPLEIVNKYGADSLRFSLMFLAASGSDIQLSTEKFLTGRNFCNKIWNAYRFIASKAEMNKIEIDNLNYLPEDESDQWIREQLSQAAVDCSDALEKYRIDEAIKRAYDFFWHNFCDWYLEIIKDNFSPVKAKNSLFIFLESIKLLHPFIPFITEEIFSLIKKNPSLKLEGFLAKTKWPDTKKNKSSSKDLGLFRELLKSVDEIRDLRGILALGQEKIDLEITTEEKLKVFWQKHHKWFTRLTNSNSIDFTDKPAKIFIQNKYWSINLRIKAADLEKFKKNLEKKINNLNWLIKKSEGKLKNEKFIQSAPPQIIEKEKLKRQDFNQKLVRLASLKKIID